MSNESTNPEETTPARVQLNPTVDPETARAIPSLAPEAAEAAAEGGVTSEVERGPLASSFTTGEAVAIPATESKLDADLEAEIAAAMQGVRKGRKWLSWRPGGAAARPPGSAGPRAARRPGGRREEV